MDDPDLPPRADEGRDGFLRLVALACVYGAAVAFAVMCSPAVGLINLAGPHSVGQHTIALTHLDR